MELQLHARSVEVVPGQGVYLLGAAARVLVDHGYQFAQLGLAVAGHAHGLATAGGNHLAAHHQDAVLGAVDEAFDDDV